MVRSSSMETTEGPPRDGPSGKEPPTTAGDSFSEFALSFSETQRRLFAAGSVTNTLLSVVELAVSTIEGCDCAGLFLLDTGVVTTPVHTHPLVVEVDSLPH